MIVNYSIDVVDCVDVEDNKLSGSYTSISSSFSYKTPSPEGENRSNSCCLHLSENLGVETAGTLRVPTHEKCSGRLSSPCHNEELCQTHAAWNASCARLQ